MYLDMQAGNLSSLRLHTSEFIWVIDPLREDGSWRRDEEDSAPTAAADRGWESHAGVLGRM